MRYWLYFFVFILSSCQPKSDASYSDTTSDTTQSIVDNSIPVPTDGSVSNSLSRSDTIFLGFRAGMTRNEFDKHKQNLLQKKKLKLSNKGLLYQIEVNENAFEEAFFGSPEHEVSKKIWTGNGVVSPEFFQDKLMSIEIRFLNTNGNNVYSFLSPSLDKKYYKSTPKIYNIFDNDKKTDTLSIGNSLHAYVSNKWSIGDINISLRFDYEILKISNKEVKRTDDVVLKYWSEYYYNQKQDEKANSERKKSDNVQNDL